MIPLSHCRCIEPLASVGVTLVADCTMGRNPYNNKSSTSTSNKHLIRCAAVLLLLLVVVYTAWVSGYDNADTLLVVGGAVDSSYEVTTVKGAASSTIGSKSKSNSKVCKPSAANTAPPHNFESDHYTPASTERYILEHATDLCYDQPKPKLAKTCTIWNDESATNPKIHQDLHAFRTELVDYDKRVRDFEPVDDIRLRMEHEDIDAICQSLELHEDGLPGIFLSGQLSLTQTSGYMEPLLPPLRHPDFCFTTDNTSRRKALFDLGYLVHDFGAMCRRLKRHSRIVLVDMGASLDFHNTDKTQPAVYLTELFRKFGFPFDHVYAFEVKPEEAEKVYQKLPPHLLAAYHWINVGVSSDPDSNLNPLKLILENFREDDLIVVKLDIDTSAIEVPLALQLLKDDRYSKLIDQFYFEHHVRNDELAKDWRHSMKGTVKESLDLFAGLREKGIPAHSWV
jgi:hypothetical protein